MFPASVNEWQWITEISGLKHQSNSNPVQFAIEYPLISYYPFLFSLSQLVLNFSDHF